MSKLISLIVVGLLACSCLNHKPNKVVLLVEPYTEASPITTKLTYVNEKGLLIGKEFGEEGETLTLFTDKPYLEVGLLARKESKNGQLVDISRVSYLLLPAANDTVRISYHKSGFYTCENKRFISSAQHEAAELIAELTGQSRNLYYPLLYSYLLIHRQENDPSYLLPSEFNAPESLLSPYLKSVESGRNSIDSLEQSGQILPAYGSYYKYRIQQLQIFPALAKRLANIEDSTFMQAVRPILNDSLCNYISYWSFMVDLKEPLIRSSFSVLPQACNTSNEVETDHRQVFDVLGNYAADIPPRTLNLLRYLCLDQMRTSSSNTISAEDQSLYLNKYRSSGSDFLELSPDTAKTGIDTLVGASFLFFIFLIEFAACTWLTLALYKQWLRKRMGLVTRRIYLLLGLAVSILLPLFTIAPQLRVIEKTEYWSSIISPVSTVLFSIYLLGCCILLYEMARWLWQVEKMRRNSWRIPDKRYTLCVLMDMESKPTIFGRKIFVSWNEWWHSKDKLAKQRILDSERYRVEHWHTFDSLLLAAVRVGCWGNPFLFRYNMELQTANDMAASNHAYCTRSTTNYTATEEARRLHSDLIMGLAGSENTQKSNSIYKWMQNIKYQLLILLVVFVMSAIIFELVGTIAELSKTSFFS